MHVVVHLDLSAFLPIAISILSILIATYALIYRKKRDTKNDEKELQDKQEKFETRIYELLNLYIRIQHDRLEYAHQMITSRLSHQYYTELLEQIQFTPHKTLSRGDVIIRVLNHKWAENDNLEYDKKKQILSLKIRSKLDSITVSSRLRYHKWNDDIEGKLDTIYSKMGEIFENANFNESKIYTSLRNGNDIPEPDYGDYNYDTYKELTSKFMPLLIINRVSYKEYAELVKGNDYIV